MIADVDLRRVPPPVRDLGPVHLVGIGGAGMSAVARVLLGQGVAVSGSDAQESTVLAGLRADGAQVHLGHAAGHVDGARTLVVSSAVRDDNPELVRARELGLLVLHRSQALAAAGAGHQVVAVAGTNGKSTTSSMVTAMLQHLGADPSFAIGAELTASGTNARVGTGPSFVVEADESDGTFVVYRPQVAVVTNVQPDHLDFYGTAEGVARGFAAFVGSLAPGGLLVACADDPGSAALARDAAAAGTVVRTYGLAAAADIRVVDLRAQGTGSVFRLMDDGVLIGAGHVVVPGRHNVLNAVAAYAAVVATGQDPVAALRAISAFTGTRRRFEARGGADGVQIFDDYAHNPGKVTAALQTGRQVAAGGRLVAVFQPHLYSRTRDFAGQFGQALGQADEVVVMDVYGAREDPVPGVSGALVADAVPLPAGRVTFAATWQATVDAVCARLRPGDVLLTVGAGDVTRLPDDVLARLAARER